MSLAEETRPEQIKLSIKESVPLQPVKMGEQLGVLRIIGADTGEVSVTSSHDIGVIHLDYQQGMGDQTAEGDYVFYLPAGYWGVEQFAAGSPPGRARPVRRASACAPAVGFAAGCRRPVQPPAPSS